MPSSQPADLTPAAVYRMLRNHAWVWITPAVAGLVLTAFAAFATPRKWKATQGMIVRSEAAGYAGQRLGKFTDLSEMRTVLETVLELARSRSVLSGALEEVGPPSSLFGYANWPSAEHIEELRQHLRVSPPGGAEFGATEVFYLTALDTDAERAVAIVDAVARHVDTRMQRLRNEQAQSMVAELDNAATAARGELQAHTTKLAAMEGAVGADLADLRNLVSPLGGQGALAQKALSIEAELRATRSSRRRNTELLAALRQSLSNPNHLLAAPSALLASQPALDRLKGGLVDAQMRTATLRGTRSASHPFVVAAKEAEQQHRDELHNEIPTAIAGVELELSLSQQREAALAAELAEVRQRVGNLAGRRAEYSMLVAAVENQTRLVDAAEKQLADARAHSAGASSASVLARVDTVEAGIRPVGPGRATVTLAGGLGGLILGIGLVFAFFGPSPAAPAVESATAEAPADARSPYGAGRVENQVRLAGWAEQFPPGASTEGQPVAWQPGGWAPFTYDAAGQPVCAG